MDVTVSVDELVKILWDYNLMHQQLEKAEAILVLGSHDTKIAEYGARLFLDGWAPLLIYSGGIGRLTEGWKRPEAEIFADIAFNMGVPRESMLLETQSTNTGENMRFTRDLLNEAGLNIQKFILVQKPYMERRAYATFKKELPDREVVVTSPPLSLEEYATEDKPKERLINIVVGDTQRIMLYGDRGYMIPQEVPNEVKEAYEELLKRGYTKDIISGHER